MHSDLPVAVSAPVAAEAQQRAPTLMAGAGGGGDVRVWARRKWLWRFLCGCSGIRMALCLGRVIRDVLLGRGPPFMFYFSALQSSLLFAIFWRILGRPRYAVTDASGIAVTTDSGSAAISWGDIRSIRSSESSLILVRCGYTSPRNEVALRVAGYSERERLALVQLVIERAGLCRNPSDFHEYLSPYEMAGRGLKPRSRDVKALADPGVGSECEAATSGPEVTGGPGDGETWGPTPLPPSETDGGA